MKLGTRLKIYALGGFLLLLGILYLLWSFKSNDRARRKIAALRQEMERRGAKEEDIRKAIDREITILDQDDQVLSNLITSIAKVKAKAHEEIDQKRSADDIANAFRFGSNKRSK